MNLCQKKKKKIIGESWPTPPKKKQLMFKKFVENWKIKAPYSEFLKSCQGVKCVLVISGCVYIMLLEHWLRGWGMDTQEEHEVAALGSWTKPLTLFLILRNLF